MQSLLHRVARALLVFAFLLVNKCALATPRYLLRNKGEISSGPAPASQDIFMEDDGILMEKDQGEVITVRETFSALDLLGEEVQAASKFAVSRQNDQSLFPTILMETTIMRSDPKNFYKWLIQDYLRALVQYMLPTLTEASVISLHGEDGGTGVVTRLTFLNGGSKAADDFRKNILPDWDKIQEIWPAERFGKGCHMEGYSFECLATREGEDPSRNSIEKWNLEATIQIWAALARRPPQWVTPEREEDFNRYIKNFMRPAKSSVKSDWFVDDNDYYVPEGGRIKPVFNVQVKSRDLDALNNLRENIKLIMKGNLSSYEIWPRDSGIGPVHIEGETTLHPHFCYVGKVPEYLSQVPPPPPPPPEISSTKFCNVISTVASDATDGVITFVPVEDAKYCELLVEGQNSNAPEVFKLPSEALSYPVTSYILGDLKPGTEYGIDLFCIDRQGRESLCTPEKKPLWTPRGSEYPGVATIVEIPSKGETEHTVNLITPSSELPCESYTLTVTASDGSLVETVTTR
eukprot:jgi/Picre1/31501/NNA_006853.t1